MLYIFSSEPQYYRDMGHAGTVGLVAGVEPSNKSVPDGGTVVVVRTNPRGFVVGL